MPAYRSAWVAPTLAALMALSTTEALASPNRKGGSAAKQGAVADTGKAQAERLAAEARTAMREKRFDDAEDALRRANDLAPSPQLELDRARALISLGRLVQAKDALAELGAGAGASPGAKRVAEAAKKLRADLERRMPSLRVDVIGPAARDARTTIEGKEVDASQDIPLDPGEHLLTVEAPGFYRLAKRVRLAEGAHAREELALVAVEKKAAPSGPVVPPRQAPTKPSAGSSGSPVPAVLSLTLGAAGIGVGAVFGLIASGQTKDVEAHCKGSACPKTVAHELDVAKQNGTISTIGFAVGGVGLVGGVVLLVTRSGPTVPDKEARAVVNPWVGLGRAGITGAF